MADRKKTPEWMGPDGELADAWTMQLRTPIKDTDGAPITELKLREPTAADQIKIFEKTGTHADIEAIYCVTGYPHSVLMRLSARDLRRASTYLVAFFKDAQEIGEQP
jgi:hypothetical protein